MRHCRIVLIGLLLLLLETPTQNQHTLAKITEKPKISFTFDDGSTRDICGYKFEDWNGKILATLENANTKAIFFVTGMNKLDAKGKYLLNSWNNKGHKIGNHTYSHKNYSSEAVSIEDFKYEFLKNDSIIRIYGNYIKLFRFPYLKEGNTMEKVTKFREVMKENGYKNGYVTIDASDWYIDERLRKYLRKDSLGDIEGFKSYYLEHIYDRAMYYEELACQLTNRHVHHTLLLHHNLLAALFLDDLIAMFQEKGWEIVDADEAYKDEIFDTEINTLPVGESLIWMLASHDKRFEEGLRFPAEDSRYEKMKMDSLGL